MDILTGSGASWIWNEAGQEETNEYVEFRHEFVLKELHDRDAKLYISADSEYAIWINGSFIDCGQWDDYPERKTYDILEAGSILRPGKNVLCVLAYCQGETSFQYIKGDPGLIYVLKSGETVVASSEQAFCRKSQSYKNGPVAKITMQLGYTFEYDARMDDGWISCDYMMDSVWKKAKVLGRNDTVLYERPVRKLAIGESRAARITAQGVFIREQNKDKTVAELLQSDFLSSRTAGELFCGEFNNLLPSAKGIKLNPSCMDTYSGIYLLIDFGREEAGFFELDIEAPGGTVVDFSYGEHLDDLRVRAAVGERNFASRYICREGKQSFIHYFKRIAGRYIQLHINCTGGEITIFHAGVKPTDYPVSIKGSFHCNDYLYNKIYDVSVRTLQLCMHEHYEDCPWREQALYSMDSRNQALCGYYCFGEYDFPEASFNLLGDGLKDDGYLELCAPTEYSLTIPSFSMAWIIELADFYLYSGRLRTVRAAMPKVKRMITAYLRNLSDDLLVTPEGERYWNFYEWTDGLDGELTKGDARQVERSKFDAPLNLFFCMALASAAKLAEACNDLEAAGEYTAKAENIKKAFHRQFWNEERQLYRTYSSGDLIEHYSELTQALAICAKACDENIAEVLRKVLARVENGLIKTTLSYSLYKYQALLEEPEKYAGMVFDEIVRDWGHMLFNKATSFWETIKGADDFDGAGSLCHGWSAIPVYFYHAYILGVKPLEPGFKSFRAEPVSAGLYKASGKVPTPYGEIYVKWERQSDGSLALECNWPSEIECESEGTIWTEKNRG